MEFKTSFNFTALIFAALNGCTEAVRELLTNENIDVNAKDV